MCKLRIILIICKVQGSIQLSQGHTQQPKKLTQNRLGSHCPVPIPRVLPLPLVGTPRSLETQVNQAKFTSELRGIGIAE